MPYSNDYIKFIEKWESTKELSKYLSHTRPQYLRESDLALEKHTLFFMIKFDESIIGAAWLENITENNGKLGIYIADVNCRGKGIGSEVIRILKEKAFKEMKLSKIYLNVRETNKRAISCYKKCGFEIIKKYPKKHFSDSSYQGVYEMEQNNSALEH
ncbi:GNAT family N-acetyltransferase [Clostridium pasteurianum]|uniref:GNAT family N-acetyltransferase n=1 Tax=Clostridium pasteurianum TaxID=1501 RepID=UPI001585D900|nr:GNAT family N-acetyltransferase [Clostridium pasteurianum]